MPHLIDCSEWQLIQAISPGISQRKSRFDSAIASHEPITAFHAHPDAELLEVELRRVFLQKDCPQDLSASQFEEFEVELRRLCNLLDRLVCPQLPQTTNEVEYPRLRSLAKYLDTSDWTFDLACGPHSTLFKLPDNKADLKRSLEAVTKYNDSLARLVIAPANAATPGLGEDGGERPWQDARIRDRASVVLGSIFEHFKCGTSHEVMLKLSDHTERGMASSSLDVMLALCPHSTQWHEVECCASHSSGGSFSTPVRNICEDLGQYAGPGRGLVLLIKEYELFGAWSAFSRQRGPPASPRKSLDELIESGAFKPLDLAGLTSGPDTARYNTREKRILAVRLSHILMDFFDTDLGSKRIHLLGTASSSLRNRPLYVSFLSSLPGTGEAYAFHVVNPALLSFAKLLLEIYVGESFSLSVGTQCDEVTLMTWAKLCYYVDKLVHERDDTYLHAVRGCLMAHISISEALRLDDMDRVSDQLTIRQQLYKEVVSKLEKGLAEATPRAHNKRGRSESPEPTPKRICNPDPGWRADTPSTDSYYTRKNAPSWELQAGKLPSGRGVPPAPRNRTSPTRGKVQGMDGTQRALSHLALVPGSSGLFDESTPVAYPPNLCQYADDFMKSHKHAYDEAIQQGVDAANVPRVKVAVLDTGLDMGHPAVQANRERIKEVKTWLPRGMALGEDDLSGHGTHVTTLLLDIAPDCDVYVAKIAEHQPMSPTHIAEAVKHATRTWKADIITMSFGFHDEGLPGCEELRDAIHQAHASRILMFAAASNTGAHGARPAFPARLSNVFCIYSGDGMGNRAPTNPTARRRVYNFLTLGEAVESAWPRALSPYPWKTRKSGTSFATPIAAGIAAFLLLYAYQNLAQEQAERFKEFDNMRRLAVSLVERGEVWV